MMTRSTHCAQFDEQRIDAVFDRVNQCRLPGAAVGISFQGVPVYRKGFGLSSIDSPLVLTPSQRIRIGSVSKQFTCLAYLTLCADGLASADDPIGKYLPELPAATACVSMRSLMANTSGIRDVYDAFCQFNEPYSGMHSPALTMSSANMFEMYTRIEGITFLHGTSWMYNNGGWLLLSMAIERISGASLEDFLEARVFKPLGMYDTLLRRLDNGFLANCATQHARAADGTFERRYWGLDNFLGAGAILSTIDDLLRYLIRVKSTSYFADIWTEMTRPATLTNGTCTNYGFGLAINSYRGITLIHHSGNALGGSAEILTVPDVPLDIAILTNRQDVSAAGLAVGVLEALLPNLEPRIAPCAAPFATGDFLNSAGDLLIQLYERDDRQVMAINCTEFFASAGEDGVLRPDVGVSISHISVTRIGDPNKPSALRLCNFGHILDMPRIHCEDTTDSRRIIGQYICKELGTIAEISDSSNGVILRTFGGVGSILYALNRISACAWTAIIGPKSTFPGFPGGLITFSTSGREFCYSTFWNRRLIFERST